MSLYSYRQSQQLSKGDPDFDALIMAAMRKADTDNTNRLRNAFPQIWEELQSRYHAPGGFLPSEVANFTERTGPDRRKRDRIVSNERREEGRDRRAD